MSTSSNSKIVPGKSFMAALTKQAGQRDIVLGENDEPAFRSTLSAALDFSAGVLRGASRDKVNDLCLATWRESVDSYLGELTSSQESPQFRLTQLIMHLRDCRTGKMEDDSDSHGHGKGERLVAYYAMLWLRVHHPDTYRLNLPLFIGHGYYKDLLVLAQYVVDEKLEPMGANGAIWELELLAQDLKHNWQTYQQWQELAQQTDQFQHVVNDHQYQVNQLARQAKTQRSQVLNLEQEQQDEEFEIVGNQTQTPLHLAKTKLDQLEYQLQTAQQLLQKAEDSQYQASKPPVLTLAAKWAVTQQTAFDKKPYYFAKALAKLVFPGVSMKQGLMKKYRQMLSTLREHLKVVEKLMCDNRWEDINFGSLPSRAHHKLRKALSKHQEKRYLAYLESVKKGTAKINAGGVGPADWGRLYFGASGADPTVEAQFAEQLKQLKELGTFGEVLSVCDVSSSMQGTPMEVCVILGIMLSQLANRQSPYFGKVITFHSDPQLHTIKGQTLFQMVKDVKTMPWGCNTDFMKTMDLILDAATSAQLSQNQMVKTLFVFSDMQFDNAIGESTGYYGYGQHRSTNSYQVMYDKVKTKFATAGYQVPNIVFWNLRGDTVGFPAMKDTPGVAMISGYSSALFKLFLEMAGELNQIAANFTPEKLLLEALKGYHGHVAQSDLGIQLSSATAGN